MVSTIRAREDIVHDHVVGALKGTARQEVERLEGIECRVVDAIENFDLASCDEVLNHGRGNHHVGQAANGLNVLHRHGGSAHTVHHAGVVGAEHQVCADAVGTLLLVVQHAHEDTDDRQNHDDFNSHRQDADD